MAYSRIGPVFYSLICLVCLAACSKSESPPPAAAVLAVPPKSPPTTIEAWHGLPKTPGLPVALTNLTFGISKQAFVQAYPKLADPGGFDLGPKTKVLAIFSSANTLRYLTVKLKVSGPELKGKWSGGQAAKVDFRGERHVWYLPSAQLQIQMESSETDTTLTYVPTTNLASVVGPPNGSGTTFASYIGKPADGVKALFNRIAPSKAEGLRLAWANPLLNETLSLKAQLTVDEKNNMLLGMNVFLKDDLSGSKRDEIEALLTQSWQKIGQSSQYQSGDVEVSFTQIPALHLRKRSHRTFTMHLRRVAEKSGPKNVPQSSTDSDF